MHKRIKKKMKHKREKKRKYAIQWNCGTISEKNKAKFIQSFKTKKNMTSFLFAFKNKQDNGKDYKLKNKKGITKKRGVRTAARMAKARQFYRENDRKMAVTQFEWGRKLGNYINIKWQKSGHPNKLDSSLQRIIYQLDKENIAFEGNQNNQGNNNQNNQSNLNEIAGNISV